MKTSFYLFLTIINSPSILMEVFPFIFLISCLYFFIELIEKNELSIYKVYGLTNIKILQMIGLFLFSWFNHINFFL